jgi:maleate isomerase
MGILSNRDIGRVSPDEIVAFVETGIDDAHVDCVFLSCTNWQAIAAIPRLAARLRVPVISSNQAIIEAVRTQLSHFQSAQPSVRVLDRLIAVATIRSGP